MTIEVGREVRANVEVVALDDSIVPENARGVVIGFQGDRVMVAFDDDVTAVVEPWEVRRA